MTGLTSIDGSRKRGRPTTVERVERRRHILGTALPVFLAEGFGNATVDQLAGAARVTKRTIYTYFGDKSGLFAEMVEELATTVSHEGQSDDDTLETLAARIVFRLHSDELVGLHRLVIAESARFPGLAEVLYRHGDVRHIARIQEHIRDEYGQRDESTAETVFSLLLGEHHRRRLLGIDTAPNEDAAADHARNVLAVLGLSQEH